MTQKKERRIFSKEFRLVAGNGDSPFRRMEKIGKAA